MKIQRNNPCRCGSGKKYKKCCYQLHHAYLTPYSVTYDPLDDSPQRKEMNADDRQLLNNIGQWLIKEYSCSLSQIKTLIRLKKKYPNVPQAYNTLANGYILRSQKLKAQVIMDECFGKIPDYFFCKTQRANQSIDRGEHRDTLEFFPNLDLHKTYPERTIFHVSELTSFYGTLGRFYLREMNFKAAVVCYDKAVEYKYYQPVIDILNEELEEFEPNLLVYEAAQKAIKIISDYQSQQL